MGANPDDERPALAASAEELRAGHRRLTVVAAIVLVQALALLGFAAWLLVSFFVDEAQDTRNAVIETVSFALLGALLVLLARATFRARRWSRGAVVTTQLFTFLGVAVPMVTGDLWGKAWWSTWVGLPLGAACVVATVLMLTPAVVVALYSDD